MDRLIEYLNDHIETNESPKDMSVNDMKLCVRALENYKKDVTITDLLDFINN